MKGPSWRLTFWQSNVGRLPQPGPAPLQTAQCWETKVRELRQSVWSTSNICSTPWPQAPAFLVLFSLLNCSQVIFQTGVEIKFLRYITVSWTKYYQTEWFIANLPLLLNFLTDKPRLAIRETIKPGLLVLSIQSVCLLHCRNKLTLDSTPEIELKLLTSLDIFKSNKSLLYRKYDKRKFNPGRFLNFNTIQIGISNYKNMLNW